MSDRPTWNGTIREATTADAAAVAAVYAPYVTDTVVSFESVPPDADELAARMEAATSWLVAERDGSVVGYAYTAQFAAREAYWPSQEISIYLAPDACGQGLGGVLVDRCLTHLRAAGMGSALAGITLPNAASVGLFESRGFAQAAYYPRIGHKFDQWLDVGWWQLQLQPGSTCLSAGNAATR